MTPDELELKVELGYTPDEWARLLSAKLSTVAPQDEEGARRAVAEVIGAAIRAAELTALEKAARVAERPIRGHGSGRGVISLRTEAVQ